MISSHPHPRFSYPGFTPLVRDVYPGPDLFLAEPRFHQERIVPTDNEVVIYSAVVSRRHVEIKQSDDNWEVINLGANGTYIDDKRISKTLVEDTMIIRLTASGPKIQIRLGEFEAYMELPVGTDKEPDGGVRDSRMDTLIN